MMFLLMGRDNTVNSLSSVGIEGLKIKEHVSDILKSVIIAGAGIVWLLFWLGLAGMPENMARL